MAEIFPTRPETDDAALFRNGIFAALVIYILLLLVNAVSISVAFWLAALHIIKMDWKDMIAWAAGTGGLGAGSLIFKDVLAKLYENK